MAKYNISISDYLDDLTYEQLVHIKEQAEKRLDGNEEMQPVKVCAISCSLSKRQTVWMLESKDTREKALQQIYEWVKEDLETLPTSSWLNYDINTHFIHPMELKEYGLDEEYNYGS